MRIPKLWATLAAGMAVLLAASTAGAHGDIPLSENVTAWKNDGQLSWVLEANFGVLTSATPDRYSCEEAFGGGNRFVVAPFDLTTWVVFTEDGIFRTENGCGFQKVRALPTHVSSWAMRRTSDDVAFAIESPEMRGIWLSTDTGQSFEKLTIDRPDLSVSSVAFSGDDSLFVAAYASGTSEGTQRGSARFFHADTPNKTVSAEQFQYPSLLAVRGERILWRGRDDRGQYVIWGTVDNPVGDVRSVTSWPADAAISTDGNEVWVAGFDRHGHGILHGELQGESLEWNVAAKDHTANCLELAGDDLLVCARRDEEGHDLEHRPSDGSPEGLVNFEDLEGPNSSCPSDSAVATTCPEVWEELAKALGIDSEGSDAGPTADATDASDDRTDTASTPVDGKAPGEDASSDGCSTTTEETPVSFVLALLCFAVFAARPTRQTR